MADPISLIGTTIAIIQLTGGCIKLLRSKIGPSEHGVHEIKSIESNLNGLGQAMEQFKVYVETRRMNRNQDDGPLDDLGYLRPAAKDCEDALQIVKEFLNRGYVKQHILGAKFDRRLGRAFLSLKEARQIFIDVVALNNHASSLRVEQHIRNLATEVQELRKNSENYQALTPELLYHYRDRMKNWLVPYGESSVNQHEPFERHRRARAPGSCTWLLELDLYCQWLHEDEAPPLLWVEGQPGLGKSVLCSTAIEHAQSLGKCTAFYYCRFNNQCTAVQAAGYLVEQIFDKLFEKDEEIARVAMDISKRTSSQTTDGLLIMAKHLIDEFQKIEVLQSGKLPRLLIFLDGLDEEPREEEILRPFVFRLLEEFPDVVRIWVTSRPTQGLHKLLSKYPTICMKEHTADDVHTYLESAMREVNEESPDGGNFTEEVILPRLLERCQGNFLFARFLTDILKDGSFRHTELLQTIREELPTDLSDIYRRIFRTQYKNRKTASELFSIVAFTRRPLRLQELEEAMAIIVPNDTGGNMNSQHKIWKIENMFHLLIEKTPNRAETQNPFVQITHSSIKDFLIQDPCVLRDTPRNENRIGEHHIADACLRYLMQERYSEPFDSARSAAEAVEGHHLLTYSAKYWDKHLDSVSSTEERSELTYKFLASGNFQTLLQTQSIAVEHHFGFFSNKEHRGIHFRKVFPQSLDERVVRDYRHFVGEWKYFLDCNCDDDECPIQEHRGEITRCLSGVMGPGNFLSNMKERHSSFMMCGKDCSIDSFQPGVADYFSENGRMVAMASLKPASFNEFLLTMDVWNPRAAVMPVHSRLSSLNINEKRSNWSLYAGRPREVGKRLSCPNPISFGNDCDLLRVGSQLFQRDEGGNYKEIVGFEDVNTDLTRYFEEHASKNGIIVIARRQNRKKDDIVSDSDVEPIADFIHEWRTGDLSSLYPEGAKMGQRSPSTTSDPDTSSDSEVDDEADDEAGDGYSSGSYDISWSELSSSESNIENSAQESASEGSTEYSSDIEDEEDPSHDSSASLSDNYSDDSRAEIILTHGQLLGDLTGYNENSSDEDGVYGRYPTAQRRRRHQLKIPTPQLGSFRKTNSTRDRLGSIAVLHLGGIKPRQIFHFDYELPVMLYHSPPAIHPFKPLVVWPLCGGDILFVDYQQKTYFIRRVLATTRFTRHVCMKVHFSEDGRYMHIATMEAQDKRKAQLKPTEKKTPNRLVVAVLVTTHRLSEHKTTRSPPILLHRVKANLGDFAGFSVSKLPITFTWTRDYAYITQSSYKLCVTRIGLFKNKGPSAESTSSPMNPRETVLLPASAQNREVRYFPPISTDKRGLVLIGSHRSNRSPAVEITPSQVTHVDFDVRASPYLFPSPPLGVYVDDEKDLGGWVPSGTGKQIINRHRNGALARKTEPFDAEDDCELEDFISPEDLR